MAFLSIKYSRVFQSKTFSSINGSKVVVITQYLSNWERGELSKLDRSQVFVIIWEQRSIRNLKILQDFCYIPTLQLLIFSLGKSSKRIEDSGGSITSDSESKDTRDQTHPAARRYRDKRARRECNQLLRTKSKQNSIV